MQRKAILLLPLIVLSSAACNRQTEPGMAALSFYQKFKQTELLGIPDQKTLSELRPFLSTNLIGLIEKAQKVEERHEADTKGQEPILSEGWNLFFTNYEGATHIKQISSRPEADRESVLIECRYQEPNSSSPHIWQLQIMMLREGGRWLIDDRIPFTNGKLVDSESLQLELAKFAATGNGTISSHLSSPKAK